MALPTGMVVILDAVLVAANLAIELVHELIDGGVEVLVCMLDVDVAALDMQVHFGLLPSLLFFLLLDGQQDVDVYHLIEMPRHAVQLVDDVLAQGGRDFEMMSADRQVHQVRPFETG